MNYCLKKYLVLLTILGIILYLYYYRPVKFPSYMLKKTNYSPKLNGFSGVKMIDLIKDKDFYVKNKQKTLNYLLSVYPMGKNSFELLDDLQIASFFNSLNYYYNCSFQYKGADIPNWDPLPCKNSTPLPYPPQGWFFNFYSYHTKNIPRIFSDSDETREELKLENFGSGRPEFGFAEKTQEKTGPGLFYYNQRTLIRDIWFPNGLTNTLINGMNDWKTVVNKKITWNYPQKWFNGFEDYSYTEITHSQPIPGMVQSLGWWWNSVTGSGIFLNVGKSLRVRNKLEAVYNLLQKMDKEFLKTYFSTDNIFDIIYNLLVNCICEDKYTSCKDHCEPDYRGVLKESKLMIKNFGEEIKRFQKEHKIKDLNEAFQKSILASINNTDYNLNRISSKILLDETIFFLGLNSGYDTIQLSMDPNINGYYTFEIIDLRLPNKYLSNAKKRDYSQFINLDNVSPKNNKYKTEFIQECLEKFINENIISIRDPLDINNNNKVQKCQISNILEKICPFNLQFDQGWYNFYCDNVPLSKEYKCLGLGQEADPKNKCVLSGENISC